MTAQPCDWRNLTCHDARTIADLAHRYANNLTDGMSQQERTQSLSPLALWAFRNRKEWTLNCRDTFGNGRERIVYLRKAACTYKYWADAWVPTPGVFDAGTDELEVIVPKAVQR